MFTHVSLACPFTSDPSPSRPRAGAIPDQFTERVLVQAFSARPSLAAEVLEEARQVQLSRQPVAGRQPATQEGEPRAAAAPQGDAEPGALRPTAPPAASGAASRQPPLDLERQGRRSLSPLLLPNAQAAGHIAPEQLLYIDLHGVSQAAASALLHRRLELLIAAWPDLRARYGFRGYEEPESGAGAAVSEAPSGASEAPASPVPESFKIVTGRGQGSVHAQGVLRQATHDTLSAYGLEVIDVPNNPGGLGARLWSIVG